MDWKHPFITVDQNQLRHPDSMARVLDDCARKGLRLLLPDGAFLEFAKGAQAFETARRSLRLLAPYRELVCSSRKISEMMREELERRAPCASLVEADSTAFLRLVLGELEQSNETALRSLLDGPVAKKLISASLVIWNNHEENKRLVQGLHNALKAETSPDELKALRHSPETALREWLSSTKATRFVLETIRRRGASDQTAYNLTRTPSISAGFASALAGVAVSWLAFGGLESTRASVASRDLNDVEYVVLGAMSHSLATDVPRAAGKMVLTLAKLATEERARMATRAELIWDGNYDAKGKRVAPLPVALPFQTVDTINESAQERARNLFQRVEQEQPRRKRLIWRDKKYVLPSVLPAFAGKVNLIYVDWHSTRCCISRSRPFSNGEFCARSRAR